MVRATLIWDGGDDKYGELYVVCPFCKSLIQHEHVDYDSYIYANCQYWCDGCIDEYFICLTGNFGRQLLGEDVGGSNECTIEIDNEEARAICEREKVYGKGLRVFSAGVLKLKFALPYDQFSHDETNVLDDEVRAAFTDESRKKGVHFKGSFSLNMAEFKEDVDLRHDGCELGYVGDCSECGHEYTSTISGD